VWQLRNGKVVRFQQYTDTKQWAKWLDPEHRRLYGGPLSRPRYAPRLQRPGVTPRQRPQFKCQALPTLAMFQRFAKPSLCSRSGKPV
jgi:hypothetical protein